MAQQVTRPRCDHPTDQISLRHGWMFCGGCGGAWASTRTMRDSVAVAHQRARQDTAIRNLIWENHIAEALQLAETNPHPHTPT